MLPEVGKGPQGRDSIIFDYEGTPCTDSKYHQHFRGRWRGVLSKGFGPDGRRKRYKVSGRTGAGPLTLIGAELLAGGPACRIAGLPEAGRFCEGNGLLIGVPLISVGDPAGQARAGAKAGSPDGAQVSGSAGLFWLRARVEGRPVREGRGAG